MGSVSNLSCVSKSFNSACNVVNLWYFKIRLFVLTEFTVWNLNKVYNITGEESSNPWFVPNLTQSVRFGTHVQSYLLTVYIFQFKSKSKKPSEPGTLEWINFNPDFLIRISTVKPFHFCPNPLFFSLLGYPLIVFSNEHISVLSLVARFSLIGCYSFSDDYSFSYHF